MEEVIHCVSCGTLLGESKFNRCKDEVPEVLARPDQMHLWTIGVIAPAGLFKSMNLDEK